MKKNTRKSTALISMVLVPLGLAGLGFTGCDDKPSTDQTAYSGTETDSDATETVADFGDEDDVFTLDPVPAPDFPPGSAAAGIGPVTWPTTQPLAQSSFAPLPSYSSTHRHYSSGGVFFWPIPYRTGYSPMHWSYNYGRPTYRPSTPIYRSSPGFRTSTPRSSGSGSSFSSRSSSSGSSGVSRSSNTSRGGFGSSSASHSSGSHSSGSSS